MARIELLTCFFLFCRKLRADLPPGSGQVCSVMLARPLHALQSTLTAWPPSLLTSLLSKQPIHAGKKGLLPLLLSVQCIGYLFRGLHTAHAYTTCLVTTLLVREDKNCIYLLGCAAEETTGFLEDSRKIGQPIHTAGCSDTGIFCLQFGAIGCVSPDLDLQTSALAATLSLHSRSSV